MASNSHFFNSLLIIFLWIASSLFGVADAATASAASTWWGEYTYSDAACTVLKRVEWIKLGHCLDSSSSTSYSYSPVVAASGEFSIFANKFGDDVCTAGTLDAAGSRLYYSSYFTAGACDSTEMKKRYLANSVTIPVGVGGVLVTDYPTNADCYKKDANSAMSFVFIPTGVCDNTVTPLTGGDHSNLYTCGTSGTYNMESFAGANSDCGGGAGTGTTQPNLSPTLFCADVIISYPGSEVGDDYITHPVVTCYSAGKGKVKGGGKTAGGGKAGGGKDVVVVVDPGAPSGKGGAVKVGKI